MIKILFADDDLKYSMLLKSFLQQHGYDVTYAGNGKKAWEQFPEVKPDLVLLDINMPEMDGYEVAERIRTIDPKVLIFFLTDRTEKNDRLKGFSLKANDYLAKPFYPEELLARIEERFSMNESETIEEEVYHFGETTFCYNNNELRTRSSRVLITSRQADILRKYRTRQLQDWQLQNIYQSRINLGSFPECLYRYREQHSRCRQSSHRSYLTLFLWLSMYLPEHSKQ